MRAAGSATGDLARRMGMRETIVGRILDPKNATGWKRSNWRSGGSGKRLRRLLPAVRSGSFSRIN
jgi:hypothetical protein